MGFGVPTATPSDSRGNGFARPSLPVGLRRLRTLWRSRHLRAVACLPLLAKIVTRSSFGCAAETCLPKENPGKRIFYLASRRNGGTTIVARGGGIFNQRRYWRTMGRLCRLFGDEVWELSRIIYSPSARTEGEGSDARPCTFSTCQVPLIAFGVRWHLSSQAMTC